MRVMGSTMGRIESTLGVYGSIGVIGCALGNRALQ